MKAASEHALVSLERATTGRSHCKRCRKLIVKDDIRHRIRVKVANSFFRDVFTCAACGPPPRAYMAVRRKNIKNKS